MYTNGLKDRYGSPLLSLRDINNKFKSEVVFGDGENNVTISNGNVATSSGVSATQFIQVLPLGVKTALGADAYGLQVSTQGGLQLWGTHFLQGDEWSDTALKIQHRNLALYGDHTEPTTLSFDNANVVEFKVMPNDGSGANNSQGAIFDFSAWQWDNDSHTTKNGNCPVQILKNNSGSLVDRSVLNRSESDSRYSQLHSENTLTETNKFEKTIIAEDGVHASGGDVVISGGVLSFEDLVDGTVVERSGAGGYQYVQGMPVKFENGVCYDIG